MTGNGEGLRRRTRRYLNVPADTIDDGNLSLKALGLLNVILNKPEGWVVRADAISRSRVPEAPPQGKEGPAKPKDGRDSVAAGLRELAEHGYYRVERRRMKDGTFKMGNAVSEEPVSSWIRDYKEYKGNPVPLIQQPDGSFLVRRADGTLAEDGFEDPAFSQVAPVTAFPEPVQPDPAGPGSGGAGPGEAVPIVITEGATTDNQKELSPRGESRAHAHVPAQERVSVTPPESAEGQSEEEVSSSTKIQPTSHESQKSQAAERRKQANALGQRWHDYCDEQGTPFPKSEPGVKHGKFAQFTGMLANILISYDEEEIWSALVTIDQRNDNFPSRKILDRELVAGRRSLMRSASTEVAVADSIEGGIIAEIIDWHATRGPIDIRGRQQLAQSLAELIAAGAEPKDIGLALNKCAKPVPAIWELRDALWGASGDGKRSFEQVWRDERDSISASWKAQLAEIKRKREAAEASSDAPLPGKTIQGGIVR